MYTFPVVVSKLLHLPSLPNTPALGRNLRQALIRGEDVQEMMKILQALLTIPTHAFLLIVIAVIFPDLEIDLHMRAHSILQQCSTICLRMRLLDLSLLSFLLRLLLYLLFLFLIWLRT